MGPRPIWKPSINVKMNIMLTYFNPVLCVMSIKYKEKDMPARERAHSPQELIIKGRRANLRSKSGPSREVSRLKPPMAMFSQVAAAEEKPASVRMVRE